MNKTKGFVAYPSFPPSVGTTITAAIEEFRRYQGSIELLPWPELDIPGRFIAEKVLAGIDEADFIIADITALNFNVTYEIGFAIGRGKRVLIVRNEPYAQGAADQIKEVGIFDTLGYQSYENSKALIAILKNISDIRPINIDTTRNKKTPVYLTEDKWKTDGAVRIISRLKKARLFFRSFDPREQSRLSAIDAIQQVSQSYGVLVHLVSSQVAGHQTSNLRSAFIAGLAAGMKRVVAILQNGADPVPLDYRDLVQSYSFPSNVDDIISDFAGQVYEAVQATTDKQPEIPASGLARFELGASSAENEFRDLQYYYLPTEGYRRALAGEVRLVVGRKGSGKTALFVQVRDKLRSSKKKVVLDLKPDGYRLLKFKDRVLALLERGSFEHTITAFWECLLSLEICHRVLEYDKDAHIYDDTSLGSYRELSGLYQRYGYEAQGDFAERMSRLLTKIENEHGERFGQDSGQMLSSAQITSLLYEGDLKEIESKLINYLKHKDSLWILFDNIDKGWSSHGIQEDDLVIVKALVEATRKIERVMQRNDIDAHSLMFIRNDVFEILIDSMSDRGKEPKTLLDWTDSDLLRELILRRAKFHSGIKDETFEALWNRVCVSHIDGEESAQYLIDRSLMRPRYLIDLINHCRGSAVTLRHERIEKSDIEKGLQVFSADLIADLTHELRDVFPSANEPLYAFIGTDSELSDDEIKLVLMEVGTPQDILVKVVDLLLWFGFLGFVTDDGDRKFIHDAGYNPKLLRAYGKNKLPASKSYVINPAFWPALGTRS